jgi:hypothetical protein
LNQNSDQLLTRITCSSDDRDLLHLRFHLKQALKQKTPGP